MIATVEMKDNRILVYELPSDFDVERAARGMGTKRMEHALFLFIVTKRGAVLFLIDQIVKIEFTTPEETES